MSQLSKIIVIGFMGAGKSCVAVRLSERWGLPCHEMDDMIVERSERSTVSEIFMHDGEPHFRKLENDVAHELGGMEGCIISTGGGVIGNAENIGALHKGGGIIVLLRASFPTLQARLAGDRTRPLFDDVNTAKQLYDEREPRYERFADVVIDTDDRDVDQVCDEVEAALGRLGIRIAGRDQDD